MAKRKRRQSRRGRRPLPKRAAFQLEEIEQLIDRKRYGEAFEQLAELNERYPRRIEILNTLALVSYKMGNMLLYEAYLEEIVELAPDADNLQATASVYLNNGRPALALQTMQQFLERYPQHYEANNVRETVDALQTGLKALAEEMGLGSDVALLMLQDQVNLAMSHGDYARARRAAERMIEQRPNFVPAYNNISQTYFVEGKLDEAIAYARRVLKIEPENAHALSNLTRYLCLAGEMEEAQALGEQLRALEVERADAYVKQAEAFTFLDDDDAVLAAFAAAEAAEDSLEDGDNALLHHLAAVATMRQGNEEQARTYWKKAGRLAPDMDLVQNNLADLHLPPEERHAPWAFSLRYWGISEKDLAELAQFLDEDEEVADESLQRSVQRFVAANPRFERILPLMLARGDAWTRQFALMLASLTHSPPMLEALRDFALSQDGPDDMRFEAAQIAREAGLLPQEVSLWIKGQWQTILLLGFAINYEPMESYTPQVEDVAIRAYEALIDGAYDESERLYKEALALAPNEPSLLNNLAGVYESQGRHQEAEALVDQIIERFPDYFFGRIAVAKRLIKNKKYEEAQETLEPLLSTEEFHISEYTALCDAYVSLHRAQGRDEAAEMWLEMWEQADPDDPRIAQYRESTDLLKTFRTLLGRRRKPKR